MSVFGTDILSRTQILHGEQYLEVFQPLPLDGILTTRGKVIEVLDKKSGAVVVTQSKCSYSLFETHELFNIFLIFLGDTYNEQGDKLFTNQSATFIVGAGNFNGNTKPSDQVVQSIPAPSRKPDSTVTYQTTFDQAAIYRSVYVYPLFIIHL